jgi:hydroxymethylglutaryl-CoA lyase
MGCYEVSLGDTIGVGTPADVKRLLKHLFERVSPTVLAGHFHDTYGQALANVLTAYQMGLRTFDSSIAGLGGCPFAKGATGNLATEDVVYMFDRMGVPTGVDLEKLVDVGSWVSNELKRANGSRAGTALSKKQKTVSTLKNLATADSLKWTRGEGTNEYMTYRNGGNLKIVLARPRNGNSLTMPMMQDLISFLHRVAVDNSISRVIITGSGKFFCTGMDLSPAGTAAKPDPEASQKQFDMLTGLFETIDNLPQTTIALINGSCFGGGVGLAFVCDLRLAAASSQFTLSEVKLGLCPAVISRYIVREWGISLSRSAMLTGRPIGAPELVQLGVVQGMANVDDLDTLLYKQLTTLRHCAPRASTLCKELVRASWRYPGAESQSRAISAAYDEMMGPSAEAKYGLKQFRDGNRNVIWDAWTKTDAKL